jgi:hypothetical protein
MTVLAAIALPMLSSCATNDNPPCRRVTAEEFMRPHTFKGIPSDEFIGTTSAPARFRPTPNEDKAFKKIWEMGWSHGWAVIWCPTGELPRDYLVHAKSKPNRKLPSADDFIHE